MTIKTTKSGYCYIPVPGWDEIEKRRKPITSHAKFDKSRSSGEIDCILKTLTPVHIGSGIYELESDAGFKGDGVVKGVVKENGLPVIPGSSLKGAFRSIAEAISYSCLLGSKHAPEDYKRCEVKKETDEVCTACGIFGAMGFIGRVSFSKAELVKKENSKWTLLTEQKYSSIKPENPIKVVALTPPKKEKAPREGARKFYPSLDYLSDEFWNLENGLDGTKRFYMTVKKGKPEGGHLKITERYSNKDDFVTGKVVEPYDFIPKDVEMKFTIKFENLCDNELGLILTAMGIGSNGSSVYQPRLGGAKPFCFGVIEIQVQEVRTLNLTDANSFKVFGNSDQVQKKDSWIKEKIDLLFKKSGDEKENILFHQNLDLLKDILRYPIPVKDEKLDIEVLDWSDVFRQFKRKDEK